MTELEKIGGDGCIKFIPKNKLTGTNTGAYIAAPQGLGQEGYASVCWTHGSYTSESGKLAAVWLANNPTMFCKECREEVA